MSFQHPLGIEEIGYYVLNDQTIGWTWRAGCTSIMKSMEPYYEEVITLTHAPKACHLFLKNPMERFRSAWIAMPYIGTLPDGTPVRQPINDYIDDVLDDVLGARSPHSTPQTWQHRKVEELKPHKLEGSTIVCGVPLLHENITTEEKPEITHRVDELRAYYAFDIHVWEKAEPWTK